MCSQHYIYIYTPPENYGNPWYYLIRTYQDPHVVKTLKIKPTQKLRAAQRSFLCIYIYTGTDIDIDILVNALIQRPWSSGPGVISTQSNESVPH